MTSQLVALPTQSRKASGLDVRLDELDELDQVPAGSHMLISACRQLVLPRELVLEVDVAKHVPHLAMMLATAFSHFEFNGDTSVEEEQPVTDRAVNSRPRKVPKEARFIFVTPPSVLTNGSGRRDESYRRPAGPVHSHLVAHRQLVGIVEGFAGPCWIFRRAMA